MELVFILTGETDNRSTQNLKQFNNNIQYDILLNNTQNLNNVIYNEWTGIGGTILNRVISEDRSEEVIFEQKVE